VETRIKVIDVMCRLMVGGSVAIVGEARVGIMVDTEELVQGLSRGPDRVSLFPLVPLPPPDWSFGEELKKEAGSESTVGPSRYSSFAAKTGRGRKIASQRYPPSRPSSISRVSPSAPTSIRQSTC
jgi:hypothetical protein